VDALRVLRRSLGEGKDEFKCEAVEKDIVNRINGYVLLSFPGNVC
jgi:hypothetical protein